VKLIQYNITLNIKKDRITYKVWIYQEKIINDFKNISNRANEYTSDRKYYQSNPYIIFKLGKINLKDIPYEQETGIYSIVLAIADVGKTPPTHIDETSDPIDFKFNESIHDPSISSDSYYIYKKNFW